MALRACTGFGFGTTAGWVTGNAGQKIFDAVSGSPSIVTTSPRTGTYCLQISPSAAFGAVAWNTSTLATNQTRGLATFWIYLPTSLPAGDVVLARWDSASTVAAELVYHQATGKLAVRFEGDSLVDGPTVSADTWTRVELYLDISTTTFTLDWWVDGAAQTQATHSAAGSDTISTFELGTQAATQTMSCRYDDVVVWTDTSAITTPAGSYKLVLLSVDPAGTVTLSGTTGNFQTFTANGTLAAWNATTARNNIDEIPPTIGGSADGFVQITNATADYVEIPMTTYTILSGETVDAVRMLVCGWATSTAAATIRVDSWNGTTARTIFAVADPNFDNSTTVPGWIAKLLTVADVDTQTELSALAFRVGFSGDATPDIGIHAIYAEVAVKEAGSPDALATPATVAAATAISATAQGGAVVTPAVVAGSTAVSGTAQAGAKPTPAALAAIVAVATPTVKTGSTPAPATSFATTAIPTPTITVGGNATATPATIAASTAIGSHLAQAGAVVTPATAAAATTISGTAHTSAYSIVQSTTAQSAAGSTTLTATLGSAPTAGHLLVLAMAGDKDTGALTLAGFTQLYSLLQASVSLYVWYKTSDGSETSISPSWATSSVAGNTAWYAEIAGTSATWVVAAQASTTSDNSTVNTQSTGTTGTITDPGLGLAFAAVDSSTSVTTVDAWGNSYTATYSATGFSGRGAIFVADKDEPTAGITTSSSFNYTGTADQTSAAIAVFATTSGGTNATATPATVAASTAVSGTAQGGAKTTPAVTAASTAISGTAQGGATATPATLVAPTSIGATIHTGSAPTPATVPAGTTIPTPTVTAGGNITINAATLNAAATIPTPTIRTGQTVSAATTAATTTISATAQGGAKTAPATLAATTTTAAPSIHTGSAPTPNTITAATAAIAPTIHTGVSLTTSTVAATVTIDPITIFTVEPPTIRISLDGTTATGSLDSIATTGSLDGTTTATGSIQ